MRIRTIKPEFWVSESIGRLTRNARLLFIGLWSFADDSGRARGALAAISCSLFCYDKLDDSEIEKWLCELERENMIRRYIGPDGNHYLDIPNWLKHQKIERPSKPLFPPFTEDSPNPHRALTEGSPLDQGSGNRDQGPSTNAPPVPGAVAPIEKVQPEVPKVQKPNPRPTPEEAGLHAAKIGLPPIEVENFLSYYESNGWKVGRNPMKCWRAAMTGWRNRWQERQAQRKAGGGNGSSPVADRIALENRIKAIDERMEDIRCSSDYQTETGKFSELLSEMRDLKATRAELRQQQIQG